MGKRLKYEKYMGMDNIITIDLHNGYTVIAIIGKNKTNTYIVQLMLKEKSVNKWDYIEEAEHLVFKVAQERIHSAVLKLVAKYLHEGFFDYYIDRFEFEQKCFAVGLDMDDLVRLGANKET